MALDYAQNYEGVSTTSMPPAIFGKTAQGGYLSSWNVTETAGSAAAASIRIRDNYAPATAITSATDGAAGNVTAGLHMYMVAFVTKHGESWRGALLEATSAGSVIVALAGIPTAPSGDTKVVGRRIYVTKAGAPATTVTPTTAQWFRIVADGSTTLAAGENNLYLPQATIAVASGAALRSTGGYALITTSNGIEPVLYTAISGNNMTGCSGGTGLMATGGAVTQPMLPDNTTTTYSFNTVDGSLTATNPVTVPTDGKVIEYVKLGAGQSAGTSYENAIAGTNGGGFQVQVVAGTVDWSLHGK